MLPAPRTNSLPHKRLLIFSPPEIPYPFPFERLPRRLKFVGLRPAFLALPQRKAWRVPKDDQSFCFANWVAVSTAFLRQPTLGPDPCADRSFPPHLPPKSSETDLTHSSAFSPCWITSCNENILSLFRHNASKTNNNNNHNHNHDDDDDKQISTISF